MGRNITPPSLQEQQFQEAFEAWQASDYTDKASWDKMFYRVNECCLAIAKGFCKDIYNPKLEERALDATIYYMERIKRDHIRPKKLSSWCYLGVKGYIQGIKQQREDQELSLEAVSSNII